jgi:glycogen phosphorylase
LGDGQEHDDDPAWDAADAEALYALLEGVVVPEFYARDSIGVPTAWVARIRESMARLTPHFSANRAVREYTEHWYLPAATAYLDRARHKGAAGEALVAWRRTIERNWAALHFGPVKVLTEGDQHVFRAPVYLNGMDAAAVCVELYAEGIGGQPPVRQEMRCSRRAAGTGAAHVYQTTVPANRPATDYSARLIPRHEGVTVPLEATQILWQR